MFLCHESHVWINPLPSSGLKPVLCLFLICPRYYRLSCTLHLCQSETFFLPDWADNDLYLLSGAHDCENSLSSVAICHCASEIEKRKKKPCRTFHFQSCASFFPDWQLSCVSVIKNQTSSCWESFSLFVINWFYFLIFAFSLHEWFQAWSHIKCERK